MATDAPAGEQLHWGSAALGWPADPWSAYARASAIGPVSRAVLGAGRPVWLVTGFDAARAALSDPRLSTDGRRFFRARRQGAEGDPPPEGAGLSLMEHMLTTDPPDHDRLRRLVSQAFTMRRVESLRPRVVEIASALLDALSGRDRAELVADYALPLPIQVICELLGVPVGDRDRFRAGFSTMLSGGFGGQRREEVRAAAVQVASYISELLAAKRSRPSDDLISALVAARDGGQALTEGELMSMVFLLLLAGHETTVNLIGNGVAALLGNPDQMAILRRDPDMLPGAIEELIRHDGPVHHTTFRFSTEELTLAGTKIPAGEIVMVVLASANRDPARFARPDALDVSRSDGQHMGFGHGPHHCLGAPLARLEAQVAFSLLLERFPRLALAVAPEELAWKEGIFLRALEALPVILG